MSDVSSSLDVPKDSLIYLLISTFVPAILNHGFFSLTFFSFFCRTDFLLSFLHKFFEHFLFAPLIFSISCFFVIHLPAVYVNG